MTPLDFTSLPESLNLTQVFVHRQLPRHSDRPAIYGPERTLTYRTLADEVDRATAVFRGLSLEMEQRVLLMLPDLPEFATAWFAAIKAGGVATAIAPDQRPEDLASCLAYTRAKLLVAHHTAVGVVDQALQRREWAGRVLVVGGPAGRHLRYEEEVERASPDPQFAPTHRDDPAAWLFTSGSTGQPRAAVHAQRDFLYSALTYGQRVIRFNGTDVGLAVPKLPFGYGLGNNLLFPLLAGAAVVHDPEKATPERILSLLRHRRPTVLSALPATLNGLLRCPGLEPADFASLRLCVSAGEALPPALYHRWRERTGVELLDGIGSSEMFHIFISNRPGEARSGSLGRVVDGYRAQVCDDAGQPLPPGETGTLWVSGGSMAQQYWQQRDATRETFRGEWCVSADSFRMDPDGYFYFAGRRDELMKVNGRWVSPLEVENALLAYPGVREAAVVGFRDSDGLEKPQAYVVLTPEAAPDEALREALAAHVRKALEPNKAPRRVHFLPALPRNERGKVLKSELKR